jgi:hypothetical protein
VSGRTITAMVLAYLVPGAGHLYLGKRARAIAFFAIVMLMLIIGLAIDGRLYASSGGSLLAMLANLATMGSGLPYFLARFLHSNVGGDVTSITYEHGTAFAITAGLMNLLLMLDAYDIAEGHKE